MLTAFRVSEAPSAILKARPRWAALITTLLVPPGVRSEEASIVIAASIFSSPYRSEKFAGLSAGLKVITSPSPARETASRSERIESSSTHAE